MMILIGLRKTSHYSWET